MDGEGRGLTLPNTRTGREVERDRAKYALRECSVFRGGISDQVDYSVNAVGAIWEPSRVGM